MSIDDACVALLLATSTPEALARYAWEVAGRRPAYDPLLRELPGRAYVVRCANPRCGLPIVVGGTTGTLRRFCDEGCRQAARYWRDPAPWRARVNARAQQRRKEVA